MPSSNHYRLVPDGCFRLQEQIQTEPTRWIDNRKGDQDLETGYEGQMVPESCYIVSSTHRPKVYFADFQNSRRNMSAPNFWDAAKPSLLGASKPEWMTFDDAWVEEVRRGLVACRVFLWYPLYCE